MSKSYKIQDLLHDWVDISKRYNNGMICENNFLRIHTTIAEQASNIKPTMLEEAQIQLQLFGLMWREEIFPSPLQYQKAMDRMLVNVMDFLQSANV